MQKSPVRTEKRKQLAGIFFLLNDQIKILKNGNAVLWFIDHANVLGNQGKLPGIMLEQT